jgi:hypothetical protein
MGIDLSITTKKTPQFNKAVLKFIQEIDTNFTNHLAQNIFYYQDSYNKTNLASVIDLSYLKEFPEDNFVSRWSFFGKLAKITDKQIEDYAKDRKKLGCNHHAILLREELVMENYDELDLIDFLKNKRDYILSLLDAEIIRIEGR